MTDDLSGTIEALFLTEAASRPMRAMPSLAASSDVTSYLTTRTPSGRQTASTAPSPAIRSARLASSATARPIAVSTAPAAMRAGTAVTGPSARAPASVFGCR